MTAEPTLPVDSYREAAPFLRRPFTPAAVKFKVQATWPTGALIVAYIDARLAVERLNKVCPHLWHDAYRPIGNRQMWCDLTVDGITRADVGEGEGKGLVSDALKRAAVKFGVGVSLYAIPKMTVENNLLKRKQKGDREEVTLTDAGERHVREVYRRWLSDHGAEAFGGAALDHGDVEGAQGDAEVEHTLEPRKPSEAPQAASAPPNVDPQTGEVREPSVPRDVERTGASDVTTDDPWYDQTVEPLLAEARKLNLTSADLRAGIEQAGGHVPERVSSWQRTICGLSEEGAQRGRFVSWLQAQINERSPVPIA